ncbi:MAG TPA: ABC transporter permease, partial [Ktedonobacterales bacterium]|nr:ABC transporter permease [Ktedonobacterales bacterium]
IQQLRSQAGAQKALTVKTLAADQVDGQLKNGDVDGVLIFPDNFATSLLSGQTASVTLRLEGSDPGIAQQLRSIVSILIGGLKQQGQSSGSQAGGVTPNIALDTHYLYGGPQYTQTDALAPIFVGIFSFFFVFLLTSVAFLRERSQGTIERLVVSPLSRTELVLGYVAGFMVFALVQSLVILLYVIGVLRVHYAGNPALLFLVTALLTIGGVNMGIFVSAFARNELQVVQFIPLLLAPQILLGGLFFPVNALPVVLKQIAYVLPLTYAGFALKDVMLKGFGVGDITGDLIFLAGFALLMVIGSALSLRQDRV